VIVRAASPDDAPVSDGRSAQRGQRPRGLGWGLERWPMRRRLWSGAALANLHVTLEAAHRVKPPFWTGFTEKLPFEAGAFVLRAE